MIEPQSLIEILRSFRGLENEGRKDKEASLFTFAQNQEAGLIILQDLIEDDDIYVQHFGIEVLKKWKHESWELLSNESKIDFISQLVSSLSLMFDREIFDTIVEFLVSLIKNPKYEEIWVQIIAEFSEELHETDSYEIMQCIIIIFTKMTDIFKDLPQIIDCYIDIVQIALTVIEQLDADEEPHWKILDNSLQILIHFLTNIGLSHLNSDLPVEEEYHSLAVQLLDYINTLFTAFDEIEAIPNTLYSFVKSAAKLYERLLSHRRSYFLDPEVLVEIGNNALELAAKVYAANLPNSERLTAYLISSINYYPTLSQFPPENMQALAAMATVSPEDMKQALDSPHTFINTVYKDAGYNAWTPRGNIIKFLDNALRNYDSDMIAKAIENTPVCEQGMLIISRIIKYCGESKNNECNQLIEYFVIQYMQSVESGNPFGLLPILNVFCSALNFPDLDIFQPESTERVIATAIQLLDIDFPPVNALSGRLLIKALKSEKYGTLGLDEHFQRILHLASTNDSGYFSKIASYLLIRIPELIPVLAESFPMFTNGILEKSITCGSKRSGINVISYFIRECPDAIDDETWSSIHEIFATMAEADELNFDIFGILCSALYTPHGLEFLEAFCISYRKSLELQESSLDIFRILGPHIQIISEIAGSEILILFGEIISLENSIINRTAVILFACELTKTGIDPGYLIEILSTFSQTSFDDDDFDVDSLTKNWAKNYAFATLASIGVDPSPFLEEWIQYLNSKQLLLEVDVEFHSTALKKVLETITGIPEELIRLAQIFLSAVEQECVSSFMVDEYSSYYKHHIMNIIQSFPRHKEE